MVLKSKTKNKIAISAVSIAIVAAALICIYHFFFSTAAIKGEKLMDEYPSPNSAYTVEIYQNDGGATTGYAVLGVLRKKLAIFIGKIIPTAQRLNGWTMIQS